MTFFQSWCWLIWTTAQPQIKIHPPQSPKMILQQLKMAQNNTSAEWMYMCLTLMIRSQWRLFQTRNSSQSMWWSGPLSWWSLPFLCSACTVVCATRWTARLRQEAAATWSPRLLLNLSQTMSLMMAKQWHCLKFFLMWMMAPHTFMILNLRSCQTHQTRRELAKVRRINDQELVKSLRNRMEWYEKAVNEGKRCKRWK